MKTKNEEEDYTELFEHLPDVEMLFLSCTGHEQCKTRKARRRADEEPDDEDELE